jgi:hypothetical protein
MAPRKKSPAKAETDRVIVMSYIHHKTKRRVYSKTGKPFCFSRRKAA